MKIIVMSFFIFVSQAARASEGDQSTANAKIVQEFYQMVFVDHKTAGSSGKILGSELCAAQPLRSYR